MFIRSCKLLTTLHSLYGLVLGTLLALLLAGCDKPRVVAPSFLPPGMLVAVKSISVTTDDGIRRIPAGELVRIVSAGDTEVTVEYKKNLFTAPNEYFSASEEIWKALDAQKEADARIATTERERKIQLQERDKEASHKFSVESRRKNQITRLHQAKAALNSLNQRISAAQQERNNKQGYNTHTHYNGSTYNYASPPRRRGHITATLSLDATQIEKLKNERDALAQTVRNMEREIAQFKHSQLNR